MEWASYIKCEKITKNSHLAYKELMPQNNMSPKEDFYSFNTTYFHLPRLHYRKLRESSTRQVCAIIWNFKKYWDMTHLLLGGRMVTSNNVVFLFEFALWSASLPATCFWDSDLQISPERLQGAKTKQTFVIFDLVMFDNRGEQDTVWFCCLKCFSHWFLVLKRSIR